MNRYNIIRSTSLAIVSLLFNVKPALSCDGSHGEFSVPGLIIDSDSNRVAFSLTASQGDTEDDGEVKKGVFSLSYTRQLDSEIQVGIQAPVITTTSIRGNSTFFGDIKAFVFQPVHLFTAEFSGFYSKVSLPTGGSGHELGHTKAESDGSLSLTTGAFFLKLLPENMDLTSNFEFSYNLPTKLNSPNVGHHVVPSPTNPTTSPTQEVTEEKALSSGYGYAFNVGLGFTPMDTLTRFGGRLGHTFKSKKALGEEELKSESDWTLSLDVVRSLSSHGTSLGLGATKSLKENGSIGANFFIQHNF
jgi:hypothetical protein